MKLDVPDDWRSEAIYQWIAPPPAALAVPMLAGKAQSGAPSASITVNRVDVAESALRELVVTQTALTRARDPSLETPDEPQWVHPRHGGALTLCLVTSLGGVRVRQVHTYVKKDGAFTRFIFAAEDGAFASYLSAFKRAFESF